MYICKNCSYESLKWTGKCPGCGEWNSFEEKTTLTGRNSKIKSAVPAQVQRIQKDPTASSKRWASASRELDDVLGGGLMPGSLVLLSGEPGIGKSTLALQMSDWYAGQSSDVANVLYISWEENIGQISSRARRLGITDSHIDLLTESDFDTIIATIESASANIVVIDSLSVLTSASIDGAAGSVSQIRTMTEIAMQVAKKLSKSLILIGHVTKDGSISWPKSLEHLVDVVLFLEGVRTENYRILRSLKNRFGTTDVVGLFQMKEDGLHDLSNPWMEFIDEKNLHLPWSALTMTVEWNRPILVEIEALSTSTKFGYPKRSARGITIGKLDLLLAVMAKFTKTKLDSSDVYLNVAHGITLREPWVDLACIAALVSSKKNVPTGKVLYFGEVSLTGVIKNTLFLERRLFEAEKLGFEIVYIPTSYEWKIPKSLQVRRIGHIGELE